MNIFALVLRAIAVLQLQTLQVYATPALCVDGVTEGCSDWTTLQNAFANLVYPANATFTICPDSVLQNIDEEFNGLEIGVLGGVVLQCGYDGSRVNNCVIVSVGAGGHITIYGDYYDEDYNDEKIGQNITVKGITFKQATSTSSIWVGTGGEKEKGTYSFIDCIWEDNGFTYSVGFSLGYESSVTFKECDFINNTGAVYIDSGPSSSFTFKDCDFINNCRSIFGGGNVDLVVDTCVFIYDEATVRDRSHWCDCDSSAIGIEVGTLNLTNSCFRGLDSKRDAIINISNYPSTNDVQVNQGANYACENTTPSCLGIYTEEVLLPVKLYLDASLYLDESVCLPFAAESCPLARFKDCPRPSSPSSAPSSSQKPSDSPSSQPSSAPSSSQQPSKSPSSQPSSAPSSSQQPSASPSSSPSKSCKWISFGIILVVTSVLSLLM